jgi:hypothetical protein
MIVSYTNAGSSLRYNCSQAIACYAEPLCQSLSGQRLDALIGSQVLAVLEPAALELHLAAAQDVVQERQRLHQHWQQQLERARYETDRAARQYQAVEPENRLVARELERRWEEALKEQRRLEEEYDKYCRSQPVALTLAEQEQIRALARDIPELWHADTTTPADRQRLVRLRAKRSVAAGVVGHRDVAARGMVVGGFGPRTIDAVGDAAQLAEAGLGACAKVASARRTLGAVGGSPRAEAVDAIAAISAATSRSADSRGTDNAESAQAKVKRKRDGNRGPGRNDASPTRSTVLRIKANYVYRDVAKRSNLEVIHRVLASAK